MTVADQGQIGSPHPPVCQGDTGAVVLGVWPARPLGSGEVGGSAQAGIRKQAQVCLDLQPALSLEWHKGFPEKTLSFQASAAN